MTEPTTLPQIRFSNRLPIHPAFAPCHPGTRLARLLGLIPLLSMPELGDGQNVCLQALPGTRAFERDPGDIHAARAPEVQILDSGYFLEAGILAATRPGGRAFLAARHTLVVSKARKIKIRER